MDGWFNQSTIHDKIPYHTIKPVRKQQQNDFECITNHNTLINWDNWSMTEWQNSRMKEWKNGRIYERMMNKATINIMNSLQWEYRTKQS
jgi:hypothetical protein